VLYHVAFKLCQHILSTVHEKIPARDSIYAHAHDFVVSDKLLLAILNAFVLQPLNKLQTVSFHVFTYTRHL
jgi:hypothetical protein